MFQPNKLEYLLYEQCSSMPTQVKALHLKIQPICSGNQKKVQKKESHLLADRFVLGTHWINVAEQKAFDPRQIKEVMGEKNYQFKHFNQSDATEFVLTFLLIISQELNDPTELQEKQIDQYNEPSQSIYEKIKFNEETYCKSIVEDTFTGRYKVVYSSTNPRCKHTYTLFEKFNVHYVEIPPESRYPTLQQCLAYTKRTDHLKTEDRMTCDLCQATTFDTKNMEIFEVGQILVLSFKRFLNGRKNDADVKVHEFLEPDKTVSKSQLQSYKGMKYKLYGAIIHYGSLSGGHHIAVCYNYKSGKWIKQNDSIVTQISQSLQQIDFSKAMTLFYEICLPQQQKKVQISKLISPNENINAGLTRNLPLQKQNKLLYSLVCSAMQWLVRSSPFQDQFNKRISILQRYKIPVKKDLNKFEGMMRKKEINKSYISDFLLKIQTIFRPGYYKSDRSQLQNFIIAFLQMVSQFLWESLEKAPSNQQKQFKQDISSDILQAEFYKICRLKCTHTTIEKFSQICQKIKFSGKKNIDQNLISNNFTLSNVFFSSRKVSCEKCKSEQSYEYQIQIFRANKLLMIELQRFADKQKNKTAVEVPFQLQIKKVIKEYNHEMYRGKVYRISAVISHRGSAEQGQYFVHCYDFKKRKWNYCVNQDSDQMSYSSPKFAEAYCLVYDLVQRGQ